MKLTTLFAFAAAVQAHFTLDYPPARGFDEDVEGTGPCGGFNTVSSNRTSFPVTGGQYQIDSHHATAIVAVVVSDGETFTSSAIQQYTLTGLGTVCAQLPALTGYSAGSNVTLQIIYKSSTESSALYQCTDVVLTNSTVDAGSQCTNGTGLVVSSLQEGTIALASTSNGTTSTTSASAGTSATSAAAASGAMQRAEYSATQLYFGTAVFMLLAASVVSI